MPPLAFSEGRGRHLFARTAPGTFDTAAHTEAEKTFGYRLPGLILGQLCDPAEGSGQVELVKRLQASSLAQNGHIFGHGRYRAMAVLGADDHRTHLRVNERDRQDIVEDRLLDLLGTEQYHPGVGHPKLEELVEFVYQATENTFDHARRTLDGDLIRQVRTVAVERHRVGTGAGSVAIDKIAPDPDSHLAKYLRRAQQFVARRGIDPERLQLLAVTVADGGVGIAAKMHGGMNIYEHDLYTEFKLVQEAVLPEGTTKPVGAAGRGEGLKKMMRSAHRLDGLFEIRTGRLALHRTFLREDGTPEPEPDFNDRDSSAFDLLGEDRMKVLTAGTVVSVLFPEFKVAPGRGRRVPLETDRS